MLFFKGRRVLALSVVPHSAARTHWVPTQRVGTIIKPFPQAREGLTCRPKPEATTSRPCAACRPGLVTAGRDRLLGLAGILAGRVADYFLSTGKYPDNNALVGLPAPSEIHGYGVDGVSVGEGGVITVYFSHLVGKNQTIVLTPSSSNNGNFVAWDCKGGSLPVEYRPKHCR